jgi:hypothetical protein
LRMDGLSAETQPQAQNNDRESVWPTLAV